MGWLAACNLFFDYVLWEEDGGEDVLDRFGRNVKEDEEQSNVLAATAGRKKLEQLVDAYSFPCMWLADAERHEPTLLLLSLPSRSFSHSASCLYFHTSNHNPATAIFAKHINEMMTRFSEALERLSSLRNGITEAKVGVVALLAYQYYRPRKHCVSFCLLFPCHPD